MGVIGMYLTVHQVMRPHRTRRAATDFRVFSAFGSHKESYALRYEYSPNAIISKGVKIIYFI